MGEMTIRSQFKRVLMAHQTKNPEIKLMAHEQKPVHVAMSDLKVFGFDAFRLVLWFVLFG